MFRLAGIIYTIIAGSILHFLYDWTGNNFWIGFFSAVDESIFQHLKLLFYPYMIWVIITYIRKVDVGKNFIAVRGLSVLAGALTIILLYYGYTAFTGDHYMIVDLAIYAISVIVTFLVEGKLEDSVTLKKPAWNIIGWIIIIAMVAAFFMFTYAPPMVPLFIPPAN